MAAQIKILIQLELLRAVRNGRLTVQKSTISTPGLDASGDIEIFKWYAETMGAAKHGLDIGVVDFYPPNVEKLYMANCFMTIFEGVWSTALWQVDGPIATIFVTKIYDGFLSAWAKFMYQLAHQQNSHGL